MTRQNACEGALSLAATARDAGRASPVPKGET
ncbi:hypothetical protein ABIE08_004152 [Kaistia defluvii]|uniref:Uncharacterized protein n=1 Tax=Kaistia defluvii TaxID=410841 RepID=A0ABV2R4I3_9HYPH